MIQRWIHLALVCLLAPCITAAEPPQQPSILKNQTVSTTRVATEKQLVNESDLIVVGRYGNIVSKVQTNRKVSGRQLVNYVQQFHIDQFLKGGTGRSIKIVSTGIVPPPPVRDPINAIYPGPMAEETYVCFLKRFDNTNMYYLIGGWQGVYPIYESKLVALQGAGFEALQGLTVGQLKERIKQL